MSEKAPSTSNYDSRDEVAQLKEKLAKAEAKAAKQEAWGAHDVTVANEGEMNFEDYMNSRPADGVVREGDSFRDAASGKFATGESYEAGLESEDEYYNRLEGGNENNADYQAPNYEEMNLRELTRDMGKADGIGDPMTSHEIFTIIEQRIEEQATKEGWSDEQTEEQLARIVTNAKRFAGKKAEATSEEVVAESDSTSRVPEGNPALENESPEEYERRNGIPPELRINEGDIVINTPNMEEPVVEAEASNETEADVEEDSSIEESRRKTFMNRAKEALLGASVRTYMALGRGMDKLKGDKAGKREGETDEAYEARVKKNGRRIAVGIVGVAAALTAYKLYGGELPGGGDGSNTPDVSGGNGTGTESLDVTPDDMGADSPEVSQPDFSSDARTVERGEGWYQTFNELNIPENEHKQLLEKVGPQLTEQGYAYFDNSAQEYRISAPGQLPQNVLELINSNR